jgi:hypothetical protein
MPAQGVSARQGGPGLAEVFKRSAIGVAGLVAGVAGGTGVFASPVLAWFLVGGLVVVVLVVAVAAVVVLRPDARLSPFERLIRFASLLLNRAPARFLPTPHAAPPRKATSQQSDSPTLPHPDFRSDEMSG